MNDSETNGRTIKLKFATGGRSVYQNGRKPTAYIFLLLILPAISFAIALADNRIGFKMFMTSLGFATLMMTVALFVRSRALRTGQICIKKSGELRFVPTKSIRVTEVIFAIACFVPAIILLVVTLNGLPTQEGSTRFMATLPYAGALIGLWLLLKVVLSLRITVGLTVNPEGLRGVRGSKFVHLTWKEIIKASSFGAHGPNLMLLTEQEVSIIIDSHQIGSDPELVARVIEYYRTNPNQRYLLSDGEAAIHTFKLRLNN